MILIVDKDPDSREALEAAVTALGHGCRSVVDAGGALGLLYGGTATDVAAVIVAADPADMPALELLRRIRRSDPTLPVIVVGPDSDVRKAVAAMRGGADDYLTRPVNHTDLAVAVRYAIEQHERRRSRAGSARAMATVAGFGAFVGSSPETAMVLERARRAADTMLNVLIRGESGTGKEVLARAIHASGQRSGAPFVVVNCATLTETLAESALFGHLRGAFTGAESDQPGYFATADGGTLLLDDIANLSLTAQSKLLRALETGEIQPIGSTGTRRVDVRLISSSNRDLRSMIATGAFREDLFYRINVIQVEIPPLRVRRPDIRDLARHFAEAFAHAEGKSIRGFSEDALEELETYDWPGNVRELENTIQQAILNCRGNKIGRTDLPQREGASHSIRRLAEPVLANQDRPLSLREARRRFDTLVIKRSLKANDGKIARAARDLGISRVTLYKLIEKYSIKSDNRRG